MGAGTELVTMIVAVVYCCDFAASSVLAANVLELFTAGAGLSTTLICYGAFCGAALVASTAAAFLGDC